TSRRRHTRSERDWSSDVCSSDLGWSGITLSLNRTLVPQLFTDAVPDLDLNTPTLIASCTIALVALVFLGIGIWRFALHIDVLARSEERRVGKACRARSERAHRNM